MVEVSIVSRNLQNLTGNCVKVMSRRLEVSVVGVGSAGYRG